jgi:tRNA (guanine-N(7)-)-methyltransferase subunit TRM82
MAKSNSMMPKRPCALAITKDDSTIISADKFGDVYSLPLIPSETLTAPDLQPTQESTISPKPFVPAANEFTIHSERNRKALENQRRQTNQKTEREGPNFEHSLLLGHVSMLTDVILAYIPGTGRSCILTADRDEHIRVSRGIPQTHVIEGFCLGHTEFISRLCIPSTRPELLISGGGDEELFVWEWLSGQLISKCNISSRINEIMNESEGSVKPAISSIHHTTLSSSGTEIVVVASEGVPAIFIFTLAMTPHPHLQHAQTIPLPGNALSIVLPGGAEDGILVSIDTIHKPGSPSQCNEPNEGSEPTGQKEQIDQRGRAFKREDRERRDDVDIVDPVLLFSFEGDKFGVCKALVKATEMVDVETEKSAVGRLGNLLYNLENLRKRDGDGGEE